MAGKKGRSGGRKKPSSLHLVKGTFREDRHGSRSAAEEEKRAAKKEPIPSAPPFLVGAARQEWRRVAGKLHARGLLRAEDRAALALYCQAYGEIRDAKKGIETHLRRARAVLVDKESTPAARAEAQTILDYKGLMLPGKSGWVRNPVTMTINQAARRVRDFLIEFGMSPSSQNRMTFHRGEDAGGGVNDFRSRHPKAHQG